MEEKKKKKIKFSLSFITIGSIIFLLLTFGLVISTIGYFSFTNTLKREYETTTYHMTNAAKALLTGDLYDDYLEGNALDQYEINYEYLKRYCNYMDVTLIHSFVVDQTNYTDAINIFNVINDKDLKPNGKYEEWERGKVFGEETTKSYKDVYKKIYNREIEYGTVFRTSNLSGRVPHIVTLVPVMDSSDNIVGILAIQRPMSELTNGVRPYVLTIAISTVSLMIFLSVLSFFNIRFRIVKPINEIIGESKNFAKENKNSNTLKEKDYKVKEVDSLRGAIDKMEDDMVKYINNLTKVTGEKEKISAELNIASQIQTNSVPNTFPAFPERSDFDIYAYMRPAKEVGGDFYNFALIDDTHLAMIMADVSGKGVPASLFMMVSNILLTEALRAGATPKEALKYVNNRICERNLLNMFVTIWVGVLNLETGDVIASNAGHDDPLVLTNGGYDFKGGSHGVAVGVMKDMEYVNHEFKINKGDKIFLYTDGVPEATDIKNNMYSLKKLSDTLNNNTRKTCKETIEAVLDSVERFVGEAPQFDDITMLCVEYKGN